MNNAKRMQLVNKRLLLNDEKAKWENSMEMHGLTGRDIKRYEATIEIYNQMLAELDLQIMLIE